MAWEVGIVTGHNAAETGCDSNGCEDGAIEEKYGLHTQRFNQDNGCAGSCTRLAQSAVLPSKTFLYERLPVRNNGANKQRAVFKGETHAGFPVR